MLVAAAVVWLLVLAGVAHAVDAQPRLREVMRRPLVLGLALGVYATSFTLLGGVGFAQRYGYDVLAFYLGATVSCIAVPIVWTPLSRVVRRLQLTSMADLLALRFRSPEVGAAVTLFLCAGLLPYLALQMRALGAVASALDPTAAPWMNAAMAGIVGMFAAWIGSRYANPPGRRAGLLAALAVESLVKLLLLGIISVAAIGALGGVDAADRWLQPDSDTVSALRAPLQGGPWLSLLLVSFLGAFLLPRQFHVAFVLRPPKVSLQRALWVLPLLLCVLTLAIPLLLVAGEQLAPAGTPPDLFVLMWTDHTGLQLAAFVAVLSGSSAMMLVTSIALSEMVLRHVILPARSRVGLSYATLQRLRTAVMAGLVGAAALLNLSMPAVDRLVDLGLVSFAAVLQLAPGTLGAVAWPRMTRAGFVAGWVGGGLSWVVVTAAPLLGHAMVDIDPRDTAIVVSATVNLTLLCVVSLLTQPKPEVSAAAAVCAARTVSAPAMGRPVDVPALRARVQARLGPELTEAELDRALQALSLSPDEERPLALRQLADRLQRNLSELVGPMLAADAVRVGVSSEAAPVGNALLALRGDPDSEGPTSEVNVARGYLLDALESLPVGVLATDALDELVLWNEAAARITGLPPDDVLYRSPRELPQPWGRLCALVATEPGRIEEATVGEAPHSRIVRLRCAVLAMPDPGDVFVVDDLTERRRLAEQVAHNDRLSSIGRVAAGVAHEVRNPLTGILMLARNLQAESTDSDLHLHLGMIVESATRIESIVRSLLALGRSGERQELDRAVLRAGAVLEEAVTLSRLAGQARELQWRVDDDDTLLIEADRRKVLQVLLNLIANAVDASAPGGTVQLRTVLCDNTVCFDVIDDGTGVPAAVEARLFEPFFTTKDRGTGLGLAVSRRIAQAHGGTLTLRRGPPTCFRLSLPVVEGV